MTRPLTLIAALLLSSSQAHAQASNMGGPCVDASQANTDYCRNKRFNAELEAIRAELRRIRETAK